MNKFLIMVLLGVLYMKSCVGMDIIHTEYKRFDRQFATEVKKEMHLDRFEITANSLNGLDKDMLPIINDKKFIYNSRDIFQEENMVIANFVNEIHEDYLVFQKWDKHLKICIGSIPNFCRTVVLDYYPVMFKKSWSALTPRVIKIAERDEKLRQDTYYLLKIMKLYTKEIEKKHTLKKLFEPVSKKTDKLVDDFLERSFMSRFYDY